MKIPQTLDGATCSDLVTRWMISADLASRLIVMDGVFHARAGAHLRIISGYRSPQEQAALEEAGRPTAAPDRSTHLTCPATGADVVPEIAETPAVIDAFGYAAHYVGLRWGGGSSLVNGRPSDWHHVDLGARA